MHIRHTFGGAVGFSTISEGLLDYCSMISHLGDMSSLLLGECIPHKQCRLKGLRAGAKLPVFNHNDCAMENTIFLINLCLCLDIFPPSARSISFVSIDTGFRF